MTDSRPRHRQGGAEEPGDGIPAPGGQYFDADDASAGQGSGKPSGKKFLAAACVLLVLVSVAFIVRDRFLSIRNLQVAGISRVPWQEVATAAGLDSHMTYFSLDEDKVAAGVNRHPWLVFESMEKLFPDTLILRVRERTPSASVSYLGISYIMAEDGVILEKTRDLSATAGLITVSGLAVKEIRVGSPPASAKASQIPACVSLLLELSEQGFSAQVKDIDLSEPDNLYLTTLDGFTVHLGEAADLRAKVGTARAVIGELKKRGYSSGVIESTRPGEATYRPDAP